MFALLAATVNPSAVFRRNVVGDRLRNYATSTHVSMGKNN